MAREKWQDGRFGKRVEEERNAHDWTQEELAAKMAAAGAPVHWTSIAKIEKGRRSVRINEAAVLADLFDVSVDALLGRGAQPERDRVHTLIAAADTAITSSVGITDITSAIRDRVDDLSTLDDPPLRNTLITSYGQAYDLLIAALDALNDTAKVARGALGDELRVTR